MTEPLRPCQTPACENPRPPGRRYCDACVRRSRTGVATALRLERRAAERLVARLVELQHEADARITPTARRRRPMAARAPGWIPRDEVGLRVLWAKWRRVA